MLLIQGRDTAVPCPLFCSFRYYWNEFTGQADWLNQESLRVHAGECQSIKTSVENKVVKITIADNGHGMSEEVKQKIFDYLFTTKAMGKGTGLGLAIA
jgi:signal transduction histidine kinase